MLASLKVFNIFIYISVPPSSMLSMLLFIAMAARAVVVAVAIVIVAARWSNPVY